MKIFNKIVINIVFVCAVPLFAMENNDDSWMKTDEKESYMFSEPLTPNTPSNPSAPNTPFNQFSTLDLPTEIEKLQDTNLSEKRIVEQGSDENQEVQPPTKKRKQARYYNYEHIGDEKFKCLFCKDDFFASNVEEIRRHIKLSHAEAQKKWQCERFETVCFDCDRDFVTPSRLRIHRVSHEKNQFKCTYPECNKAFLNQFSLDVHAEGHKNPSQNTVRQYQCSACGKRCANRSNFRRHIREKHEQKKTFICTTCGEGYPRKEALQNHQKQSKHQQ